MLYKFIDISEPCGSFITESWANSQKLCWNSITRFQLNFMLFSLFALFNCYNSFQWNSYVFNFSDKQQYSRHGEGGCSAAEGDLWQGVPDEAGPDPPGGKNPKNQCRTLQRPRHGRVSVLGYYWFLRKFFNGSVSSLKYEKGNQWLSQLKVPQCKLNLS